MGKIVTLLTDFGNRSPYSAALKGVILGINPNAAIVDLSHEIPPQNLRHAAYYLLQSAPYFCSGTVHVVVVDPGVGADRSILLVELGRQYLIVPDNGCWTWLDHFHGPARSVRHVTERRYWRSAVSSTFHGRDIFAPVAGWLSRGVAAECFGPEIQDWVRLPLPACHIGASQITGEVMFIDDFGNVVTSIPENAVPPRATVRHGKESISRRLRTYAEGQSRELVYLISSSGFLEIAEVEGNAAQRLSARVGDIIHVLAE
jgi:S-adenosyl-L-methionine hydrolase (adenosine-forming)